MRVVHPHHRKMTVSQMMKKKYEVEQAKPKEALAATKQNEQQAPHQQEAKVREGTPEE